MKKILNFIMLFVFLAFSSVAFGANQHVFPSDSIQTAIDNATDGDKI
jgi:hypothetical protein